MNDLSTKDIAKLIRKQLKKEFPDTVFSVITEHFSGGSSITISIMKTPFRMVMPFEDIPEKCLREHRADIIKGCYEDFDKRKYIQLNPSNHYDITRYNNGIFLTEEGYKLFKRVVEIVEQYRRVERDIQTDYYYTNFFFDIELGKWDVPFMEAKQ